MVQFNKLCSRGSILLGAGALLLAATPVLAGGHAGASGFRGAPAGRFVSRPGVGFVRPGVAVVRPGNPAMRPGLAPIARQPVGPGFRPFVRPGPYAGFYGPRRHNFFGAYGRYGYDFGYAYPRPRYGWGSGWGWGGGALPGSDFGFGMQAPVVVAAYPSYPDGYGGASDTPTGYGVSYNVPPPAWAPPKIITIKGNRVHSERYVRPRQVVVVRGSASVD